MIDFTLLDIFAVYYFIFTLLMPLFDIFAICHFRQPRRLSLRHAVCCRYAIFSERCLLLLILPALRCCHA